MPPAVEAVSPDADATPAPAGPVLGVCSLLHETGSRSAWNSLTETLCGVPVVRHALERLAGVAGIEGIAVPCWDEQVPLLEAALAGTDAQLIPHGPAKIIPSVNAVATAQQWADGWRGGLLQTIPQDRGFFAPTAAAVARAVGAEYLFLIEPSFAVLDTDLCAALIAHAASRPGHDLYFTPAAPGLAGVLARAEYVAALAESKAHPGQALHYQPQAPQLDPVAADCCSHAPAALTRTLHDCRIDDGATLAAVAGALEQAPAISSAGLLEALDAAPEVPLPVELTIELSSRRPTQPNWLHPQEPRTLQIGSAPALFEQAVGLNRQVRITFGRFGDPLCHPDWQEALALARAAGAASIHVETDLLCEGSAVVELAEAADVISVHLPAVTAEIYRIVTGVDQYDTVTRNLARLIAYRRQRNTGLPLIVPTFIKTAANIHEMEPWYDGWLDQAGNAVVRGPDAFGNEAPPGIAVARMIRSERRPRELVVGAGGEMHFGSIPLGPVHTLDQQPLRDRLQVVPVDVASRGKEAV